MTQRTGLVPGSTTMAAIAVLAFTVGWTPLVEADITRIVITRVESPTFEGVSFGAVGQCEKLVGRAFGEVDPDDPRNTVIVDIALDPSVAGLGFAAIRDVAAFLHRAAVDGEGNPNPLAGDLQFVYSFGNSQASCLWPCVSADACRDIGSLALFVVVVVAREPRHGEWCDAVGEVRVDDQIEVPPPRDCRRLAQ